MKWCKRSFTAVCALLAFSLSLLSVDERSLLSHSRPLLPKDRL